MATALDDDLIGLVFGFYHSAATDAVLSFATTVIGSNYSHQPCFLLNSVISLAMVSVLGYSFHHIGIRGQQREDGITPHFSQFGGDLNVVIRGKEWQLRQSQHCRISVLFLQLNWKKSSSESNIENLVVNLVSGACVSKFSCRWKVFDSVQAWSSETRSEKRFITKVKSTAKLKFPTLQNTNVVIQQQCKGKVQIFFENKKIWSIILTRLHKDTFIASIIPCKCWLMCKCGSCLPESKINLLKQSKVLVQRGRVGVKSSGCWTAGRNFNHNRDPKVQVEFCVFEHNKMLPRILSAKHLSLVDMWQGQPSCHKFMSK